MHSAFSYAFFYIIPIMTLDAWYQFQLSLSHDVVASTCTTSG
jgi:hypothetical protein